MPPKRENKISGLKISGLRASQRLSSTTTPLGSPKSTPDSPKSASTPPTLTLDTPLNVDSIAKSDDNPATSVETPTKKKSQIKKHCPCGKSSGGECWLMQCVDCKQVWHNACAGLKADFPKSVLDSLLKTWQCPWCYCCPYSKPDSHVSTKNSQTVSEKVLIASTIKEITDAISEKSDDVSKSFTTLEHRLTSVNADVDAIRGTQDLISQKVLPIGDIETHMQHQLLSQASLEHKMKTMQSSLVKLQEEVSNFSQTSHQPLIATSSHTNSVSTSSTPLSSPGPTDPLPHQQVAISDLTEDFLTEDSSTSVVEFLDSSTFKTENGHSVLSFGVPYKYTGSMSSSQVPEVPDELKPLMEQINGIQKEIFHSQYPDCEKYGRPAPTINSLLINKYIGPESFLPKHADDEDTIHCESSIFTLSLGAECSIEFSPKNAASGDAITPVSCKHRSLYRMSRKSQEFFNHELKSGSLSNGTRYSLTFRSVSKWNNNSTCIIGDSNTGSLNFGSDKRKTFGDLMPGHRFWAPTIESIDPAVCCAYKNVVILCGINNIKKPEVKNPFDLDTIYQSYLSKISKIRELNPNCRIFICPILPTKNHNLNEGALYFNKLIFNDLIQKDWGIQCVWGFDSFLDGDGNGLLASNLSKQFDRYNKQDILHLNLSGVRLLAGLIKKSILTKFHSSRTNRQVSSNRVNGQLYSNVARSSSFNSRAVGSATGGT